MVKGKKRRSYGRWKRRFSHRDRRIPIVPVIALASSFITPNPSGRTIVNDVMAGKFDDAVYDMRERFACIDNTGAFRMDWILPHYGPLIAAVLISKLGGKFVNPTLSKLPFVGKRIKL